MGRSRRRLPEAAVEARIQSLSHDGRGLARVEGKAVFIHGALPGERVRFRYTRCSRRHDEGVVVEVLEPSPQRVEPRCPHFGVCGGCSLQHLAPAAQVEAKQQTLLDNLRHLGGVEPETVLAPITGPVWRYRRKARLGVKYVAKKGRVLVGFRERASGFIAELERCEVLIPEVGGRLGELAGLIETLEAKSAIAQIEVAGGENGTVLVFRNLQPLSEADRGRLIAYAQASGLCVALQPGGPETVTPLWPAQQGLYYTHPQAQVRVDFSALDFTQVNAEVNRAMVQRAMELLQPGPTDEILDLFCGLGNFTLPLARRAARVIGVEGDAAMVARARENARRNGIDNTEYYAADLDAETLHTEPWLNRRYARVLLDPPRSGARALMPHMARLGAERIVYVSCHPGTLARDAGELVRGQGYRLAAAGVMDMFPHTAHVESIALFLRR